MIIAARPYCTYLSIASGALPIEEAQSGAADKGKLSFWHRFKPKSSTSSVSSSGKKLSLRTTNPSGVSTPVTSDATPGTPGSTQPIDKRYDGDVAEAAAKQLTSASAAQHSITFTGKAVWIIKDRDDLKNSVEKIADCMTALEQFVRGRTLNALNEASEEALKLPADILEIQYTLKRLHQALLQTSTGKIPSFQFGIKLVSKHSSTKELVKTQYDSLGLREHSYVYILQALKGQHPQQGIMLLAETLRFVYDNVQPNTYASSQDQSISQDLLNIRPLDPTATVPFVHISQVAPRDSPIDKHNVFQDVSNHWARTTDLHSLFQVDAPSKPARYKLAALIGLSHLHLALVDRLEGRSKTTSYCYFDHFIDSQEGSPSTIDGTLITGSETRLSDIYHFPGFGSPLPTMDTSAFSLASAESPIHNQHIVELGFLLYQIGCWTPLETATNDEARERLRNRLIERTHELVQKTGLRFAEAVLECLNWKLKPAWQRQGDLPRLYHQVVTALVEQDKSLRLRAFELG